MNTIYRRISLAILSLIPAVAVNAQVINEAAGTVALKPEYEKYTPLTDKMIDQLVGDLSQERISFHHEARKGYALQTASVGCDSLQTILNGTNGNDGIMFDITSLHDITITKFAAVLNPVTSGYIQVYYKPWTCTQGFDTVPSAWTLIDSAMVTSAGSGQATEIPISINVTISANTTAAFYITGTGAATLMYSNGSFLGAVYASDTMIQVKQGIGKSYPFGNAYSPRLFNGEVYYCEAVVGVDETSNEAGSFTIQPNPFSDHAVVSFGKTVEKAAVRIYDVLGKEVRQASAANADRITITKDGLHSGVYFISVTENGKPAGVKRMIVQ